MWYSIVNVCIHKAEKIEEITERSKLVQQPPPLVRLHSGTALIHHYACYQQPGCWLPNWYTCFLRHFVGYRWFRVNFVDHVTSFKMSDAIAGNLAILPVLMQKVNFVVHCDRKQHSLNFSKIFFPMMTPSHGNASSNVGPWWGATGDMWIPLTKGQ